MDSERLLRLLDLYTDEALPPAEKAELEQMLLSSAEARTVFWDRLRVHRLLREVGLQSWGRRGAAKPAQVRSFPLRRMAWLAAAAVLLLAGLAFSRRAFRPAEEPTTRGVAVLGQTVDAVWAEGVERRPGAVLTPGLLRLKSGLAQIEFVSGARVILEGPADFQVVSPMEGFCRVGRLSAVVPAQARGFQIGASKVAVVDLGTEFGFEVQADGAADVHVFRGQVALRRGGEDEVPLAEGGSMHVSADGALQDFDEAAPIFPTTELLEARAAAGWRERDAAWHLAARQMAGLQGLLLFFDFDSGPAWARTLPNASLNAGRGPDGSIVGCRWTDGRWPGKRALEFRAVADRVRISLPGELPSLTFAAWVRVDSLNRAFNSLLMGDGYETGDVHWQITHGGQLVLGVQGPNDSHGHDYRSRPVFPPERLGQWTHLAVVFDRTTRRVAHFVDGQRVSDEALLPEADHPLRLEAAELGNWNPDAYREARPIRNLNGRMDEFLVFNRGLSAMEVLNLFHSGLNRP